MNELEKFEKWVKRKLKHFEVDKLTVLYWIKQYKNEQT